MTTARISDFDDVILFELQKKMIGGAYPSLTFNEIWKASTECAPNFFAPVDPTEKRKAFAARLFAALDILNKCEHIAVNTNGENKVESVRLTDQGKAHVSKIIFTHQKRYSNV